MKPYATYQGSGACFTPTEADRRWGISELVIYNPAPIKIEVNLTIYFTEREPYTMEPVIVKPETNELIIFPDVNHEIFANCGFFGVKAESDYPILLNMVGGFQIHQGEYPKYRGGCINFHGTKLDTTWRIPDGLWLEWNLSTKGDLSKAGFPFNESELYFFLNPHPFDVEMEMLIEYRRSEHELLHFTLPAERNFVWDNLGKVHFHNGYAIRTKTSASIHASAVRNLYGLTGIGEWGLTVHCAMHGIPGEIS